MAHPEFTIILTNLIIVLIAYLLIYPKFAGSDGHKIATNDLLATTLSLTVAGSLFWGSGHEFSAYFFTLNWFWFALLTHALIEIPFMLWYFKKHNVWASFKPKQTD